MYPYGSGLCDKLVPKNDDGSEGPFDLGVPFSFYNNVYSTVYINTNGFISFLSQSNKQLIFQQSIFHECILWLKCC